MKPVVATIIISSLKHSLRYSIDRSLNSAHLFGPVVIVTTTPSSRPAYLHSQDLFVQAKPGYGFGYQNNLALEHLFLHYPHITHILFLNDDAWLAQDFPTKLKELPPADIYIPLIYQNSSHQMIDAFGMEIFQSGYAADSHNPTISTQWGTAACIVFAVSFVKIVINTYGFFFNPQLDWYFEDVELGYRSLPLRPKIIKSSKLVAYHHRAQTSSLIKDFNRYHIIKNYFWSAYMSFPLNYRFWLIFFRLIYTDLLRPFKFNLIWQLITDTYHNFSKLSQQRKHLVSLRFTSQLRPYLSHLTFRSRRHSSPIRI